MDMLSLCVGEGTEYGVAMCVYLREDPRGGLKMS